MGVVSPWEVDIYESITPKYHQYLGSHNEMRSKFPSELIFISSLDFIVQIINFVCVLLLLINTRTFGKNHPTTFICVCNVSATSNHSFGSALPSSSWLLRAAVQWRMRYSFVQNCTYCCLYNLPCIPVVFVDNIHHQTSWKNGDENS